MDVAKNILLTLLSTISLAPHLYQMKGRKTKSKAKDQGHRTLCLLQTQELANGGEPVRWEDSSSNMQECIVEKACVPDTGARDLRTGVRGKCLFQSLITLKYHY